MATNCQCLKCKIIRFAIEDVGGTDALTPETSSAIAVALSAALEEVVRPMFTKAASVVVGPLAVMPREKFLLASVVAEGIREALATASDPAEAMIQEQEAKSADKSGRLN